MSTSNSSSTDLKDPSSSSSLEAVDPHRPSTSDGAVRDGAVRDDSLQRLLVETRAAFDVLVEMNALMYADGDQEEYQETLDALKQRHRQAIQTVRNEFFGSSTDASPPEGIDAPASSS